MPAADEKAETKKRNQQAIAILRIGRPLRPQVVDQPEPEVRQRQQYDDPLQHRGRKKHGRFDLVICGRAGTGMIRLRSITRKQWI